MRIAGEVRRGRSKTKMVTAAALALAMGVVRPTRATEPTARQPASTAGAAGDSRGGAPSSRGRGARPRTVFIPSSNNPLVAIRVLFRLGAADDPPGKEGLAALTADIMGQGGTKRRTYAEVLDALYPLAAQIRVTGDKETMVFEGTVHRDNLAAFADLIAEQILEPRFADDDFTRNRQDAIDQVTKTLRGNNDEELGKQALGTLMYGAHPYGHPTVGTVAGLSAVTVEDVKSFYARTFARDRLIVGVAGGYPDGFAAAFADRFRALPAKSPPPPKLPKLAARPQGRGGAGKVVDKSSPGTGAEVLLVQKDARAVAMSLGHPIGITRADPDFYPLTVARSYLGEHRTFNGVLMNRLRGDRGLNYGDYAYVENFIQDGWSTFPLANIPRRQQHFEIWLRPVPPQNALFALRGAVYYTRKLIAEGIPQAGFESTKKFLLNYADLWTQDVSRRLGYAMDAAIYGKDLVGELKKRLPAMKRSDVDRAVRKHLQMNDFSAVLVTDRAAELREALLSGKPTPITYDTKGTPDAVLAEDKLIEKEPLPVGPENVRVVPVEALFEK